MPRNSNRVVRRKINPQFLQGPEYARSRSTAYIKRCKPVKLEENCLYVVKYFNRQLRTFEFKKVTEKGYSFIDCINGTRFNYNQNSIGALLYPYKKAGPANGKFFIHEDIEITKLETLT